MVLGILREGFLNLKNAISFKSYHHLGWGQMAEFLVSFVYGHNYNMVLVFETIRGFNY
jgi:L-asparagine transporter-like permease